MNQPQLLKAIRLTFFLAVAIVATSCTGQTPGFILGENTAANFLSCTTYPEKIPLWGALDQTTGNVVSRYHHASDQSPHHWEEDVMAKLTE